MGAGREGYIPFGREVAEALLKYTVKHRPEPLAIERFFLTVDGRPLGAGKAAGGRLATLGATGVSLFTRAITRRNASRRVEWEILAIDQMAVYMPAHRNASSFICQHLESLKEKNLYRQLRVIESAQGSWVKLEGKEVLNLCSNDYLGLATHPQVTEAAAQAIGKWGCGSGASRLICGTHSFHQDLERRLAEFKGVEATLLYNSGYNANLGIISAMVGKGDCVFSDELNHASIIDGCRLSQAKVIVFPHNDMEALEEKLHRASSIGHAKRKLIVVDGVFSMDGDLAPLPELVNLAEKHDCLLMVDEAHATGVLGPKGRGVAALFGMEERVPILMGTLGKALGSSGGFAAGSQELIEFLINTSRSFIFTTASPAGVVLSAQAALDVLVADPSLPLKVLENASYLRDGLNKLGYNTLNSETQIIPLVIGDAARALEMSRLLLNEGVLATAIRPPTVPEGTCRIRTTVMATHTRQDLDFALRAFEKSGRRMGIIQGRNEGSCDDS